MSPFRCQLAPFDSPATLDPCAGLGRSAQLALVTAYLDRLVQLNPRNATGLSRATAVLLRRTSRLAWCRLRGRSVRPYSLLQLWQAVNARLAQQRRVQSVWPLDVLCLDTAMLLLSDLQSPDRPRFFCLALQPSLARALEQIQSADGAQRWQLTLFQTLTEDPDRAIASACRCP
jgi:hypothetical protein